MQGPIEAARDFQAELRQRSAEIEKGKSLPADIAGRFASAGFYRLCVPGIYGGLEADARTTMGVIETLAEADGSAAWCVMIGATSGVVAAYMPPDAAREIFASPDTILAGVFASRGNAIRDGDAWLVNGRWQWGSGSPNASHIMGGCTLTANGERILAPSGIPDVRMMIVPVATAVLFDNWDVSGLCGTGSQDFAIVNQRVPASMSVGLMTDQPLQRPLYAFPVFGFLAAGIASVMLGLARASITELVAIAGGKTPEGHRKPLAARSRTQEDVAQAEALVRSARAFMHEAIDNSWHDIGKGHRLDTARRRDIRLAATNAARASVRAVDLMYNLGGGTSVYRSSPLQRIFRDVHTASQHMMVSTPTLEMAGRVMLGQETDISQL